MDFILNRLNRKIEMEENELNKLSLCRERLEYCLIFLLNYLWNKNFDMLLTDDKIDALHKLQNLQIGDIVSIIRKLDLKKQTIGKKAFREIDKYPEVRNGYLGHGYTHSDCAAEITSALQDIYAKISAEINIISQKWTLVYVKKVSDHKASGEKYSNDGLPDLWACDLYTFEFEPERTYALNENMEYIKLSPFIEIRNDGENKFLFRKLKEKLTGKVLFNQLIATGSFEKEFHELAEFCVEEQTGKRVSANSTIMNVFNCNYNKYITEGSSQGIKQIQDFIENNNANVNATIWGHGGVGKTACIQKVCMDYFHRDSKKMDYIIFLSAKDRVYNTYTGQISVLEDEHPIRTYEDIMFSIGNMIYPSYEKSASIEEIETEFIEFTGKILVVIDDLETFERKEIDKIKSLIPRLDAHVHKIIFTTRSNQIIGQEIAFNEMDSAEMITFLQSDISERYPLYLERFKEICEDEATVRKIHEATDGRPIFLFQFVEIFVQNGIDGNKWKTIKSSENAKEFLYGRIYRYLTEKAQILFCVIYKIADTENLLFSKEMLQFVVSKYVGENDFDIAFSELIKLKVIELYGAENYRIYSKEIIAMMDGEFKKRLPAFQSFVRDQQKKVGGKQGVIKSIYQARLDEANNLRQFGNKFEVEERYRSLLKDEKTPIEIKRKSLCNLCSYFQITVLDNRMAIKTFKDFFSIFRNDATICRLYAQALWTESEKNSAIQIIEDYFKQNNLSKTAAPNLEMAYLLLAYRANFILENYYGLEAPMPDNKSLREYSEKKGAMLMQMDEFVSDRQIAHIISITDLEWKNFSRNTRHNAEMLISQVIKIYVILAAVQKKYVNAGIKITGFALQYLGMQYKASLSKTRAAFNDIETKINRQNASNFVIEEGRSGFGTVTGVAKYGVFVQLNAERSGLLHISNMGDRYISCIYDEIKVGEKLNVRINKIDKTTGKISLAATNSYDVPQGE